MRAEVVRARPPRTAGHAQRDAAIQQFADAGLVAVLSCNGSNPEADIQIVKGPQPGEVIEAWITAKGIARLPSLRLQKGDILTMRDGSALVTPTRKPARKPAVSRKKR